MVIIHCIDSLRVGGAEILLRNTIHSLPDFHHIVVYLDEPSDLKADIGKETKFYCLGHKGWKKFFRSIFRLGSIIRRERPILVHSHLFYSSLIARFAAGQTPLITSIHSIFSIDAFQKNRFSIFAERLSLKKSHTLVAVSEYVLTDYLRWVKHKGLQFVLYNFLPDHYFKRTIIREPGNGLKCIAVGGLKEAKNYSYLLEIFEHIKSYPIELDIYGEGPFRNELSEEINKKGLKIKLLGEEKNIWNKLDEYDLFIQASRHEGFGLSVIEAMGRGLPVFLSDIPVFVEVTRGKAHFFPLDNAENASEKLVDLFNNAELRYQYVIDGFSFVSSEYKRSRYIQNLTRIYSEVTHQKLNLPETADKSLVLPIQSDKSIIE